MKLQDFKKKSTRVLKNTDRTIKLIPNSKKLGIDERELATALEPMLSKIADSETNANSAFARTEDFQKELLSLSNKVNSQNIKLDQFEKLNAVLMESNAVFKKRVEILTDLVENGPAFSPGGTIRGDNVETKGMISSMKNLGTIELPLFNVNEKMELITNGK